MRHDLSEPRQRLGGQRVGRRRLLGVGAGIAGAATFALACGSGGKSGDSKSAQPAATNAAVSQATASGPRQGGTARVRFSSTPPLDPVANSTFQAQRLAGFTHSRLLRFKVGPDPAIGLGNEIVPDLAAGWELTADGAQLTFKLQPNARFHNKPPVNGRAVDSEDVKFALERFRTEPKNQNRAAFGSPDLPLIDKVETPDPQTFVVKLARPFAPVLNLFANSQYLWILPRESGGEFDPAKDQIGSGPWVFESIQPDVEVKLKANRSYFVAGRPYADAFSIPIIPDTVQARAQFQAGRLDIEDIVYEDKAEVTKSNPNAQFVGYLRQRLPFIAFQLRTDGPFRDERVRRAVSMAFDRDALLQLSFDGQGAYHNMVPAWMSKWWLDPRGADMGEASKYFRRDVREARAMLQAAGAANLSVRYIYTNNIYGEQFNQWAEAVGTNLKDIGINVTIVTQDYAREYIPADGTFAGKFEGMFFGYQTLLADPHDYLFNTSHSRSKRNHGGVNDPQLDAMIDKEAGTLDEPARIKAVKDIQRYMSDKMYYVPGFTGPVFTGVQPWIKNFQYSPSYGAGTESYTEFWIDRA